MFLVDSEDNYPRLHIRLRATYNNVYFNVQLKTNQQRIGSMKMSAQQDNKEW